MLAQVKNSCVVVINAARGKEACRLMSVVQGSDPGAHWAKSHRLDFTHHMTVIPQGPAVKLLVKEPAACLEM